MADPEPWGICDASGFRAPLSRMVKQWDGAMVDRRFADKRNPQDFVRGVRDDQSLPFSRPEAPNQFLSPGDVTAADL